MRALQAFAFVIHQYGIGFQFLQELVGAFLLIGHDNVLFHILAVAGAGGDEPSDNDVFLEATEERP